MENKVHLDLETYEKLKDRLKNLEEYVANIEKSDKKIVILKHRSYVDSNHPFKLQYEVVTENEEDIIKELKTGLVKIEKYVITFDKMKEAYGERMRNYFSSTKFQKIIKILKGEIHLDYETN